MRQIITLFFISLPIILIAEEIVIPKSFVNGEIADAIDFNANNDYLIEKIKERKADISQLTANARWANADGSGAVVKQIDCSANQSALIEAYHAHAHEDFVIFLLTGSCFGAYRYTEEVGENGEVSIGQIQPRNQVVALRSDRTVNPTNRAKIIPRKLVVDREYFAAGLVSSFGNGLYINDIDIEMGADDTWGVLFSRSSNGDLTNVSIKGAAEPNNQYHRGVVIQNGAAAYVGGNDENAIIEEVSDGILIRGGAIGNIYGTLQIKSDDAGIGIFGGGTVHMTLQGEGKITAPRALNFNHGGVGWVYNGNSSVSIDGDVSLNGSKLLVGDTTVFNSSKAITLFNSSLGILHDNSGVEASMLTCHGTSVVGIPGLSLANNGGNGCLDNGSWKTLIESVFPSSSGSSMQKNVVTRQPRQVDSVVAQKPDYIPLTDRIKQNSLW